MDDPRLQQLHVLIDGPVHRRLDDTLLAVEVSDAAPCKRELLSQTSLDRRLRLALGDHAPDDSNGCSLKQE